MKIMIRLGECAVSLNLHWAHMSRSTLSDVATHMLCTRLPGKDLASFYTQVGPRDLICLLFYIIALHCIALHCTII